MNDRTKKFKEKLAERHPDRYELLSEYEGSNSLIKYKCLRCNNIYTRHAGNIYKKNAKCKGCHVKKYDTEWFKEKLFKKMDINEYSLLSEYKDTKEKVKMKHNKCGKIFEATPNRLLSGDKCPHCAGNIKKTIDDIFENFKSKMNNGDDYELIKDDLYNEYANIDSFVHIRHKKCNNIFKKRARYMSRTKPSKCPHCAGNIQKTNEDFSSFVSNITNGEYELISEYVNTHENVKMKHNKCGNVYLIRPTNFISHNHRCPKCSSSRMFSNKEKEVLDFIKSFYKGEIVENERKLLKNNKEIDIYLPELKIAIEFNGLYWHSEARLNNAKKYHYEKMKECEEKNIRLITLFENEWDFKKDIVKSKIKHILGYNNSKKIYARDCYIKTLDNETKNSFLENNHIQGKDISKIRLGLFGKNDEKLYSVMTFGKMRRSLGNKVSRDGEYELIRFASDIDYLVIGGFSKILKYFLNNYEVSKIKTYADLRWSNKNNNVYESYFHLSHLSKPSYFYTHSNSKIEKNKYVNRYSMRKHLLKDKFPNSYKDDLTEREILAKENYFRVWDCGNLVFEYCKE
ncbi:hypothetical protein PALS2_199 [Staphylococcus phage PALS_2]|nr:hypothetical protein PALS2_199 [Staphylococcus phage PALS_2]